MVNNQRLGRGLASEEVEACSTVDHPVAGSNVCVAVLLEGQWATAGGT